MAVTHRQIEAFRAVMVTGTVTHAADYLSVSQPAVSRLLASLEYELGYTLFERERGRMKPTAEAQALYVEVERSFVGLTEIETAARSIGRMQIGSLRIVTMPATSTGVLPDTVAFFAKKYPEITVSFEIRTRHRVIEWIASQQYDLGVTTIPVDDPAIRVRALGSSECVCVLPADHPLASRDVIHAIDLEGEDFISLPRESFFRHRVDRAFEDAGIRRNTRIEVRTGDVAMALVARGAGVTVLSPLNLADHPPPTLVVRPFRPALVAEAGVIFPKHKSPSRLAQRFMDDLAQRWAEMTAG